MFVFPQKAMYLIPTLDKVMALRGGAFGNMVRLGELHPYRWDQSPRKLVCPSHYPVKTQTRESAGSLVNYSLHFYLKILIQ